MGTDANNADWRFEPMDIDGTSGFMDAIQTIPTPFAPRPTEPISEIKLTKTRLKETPAATRPLGWGSMRALVMTNHLIILAIYYETSDSGKPDRRASVLRRRT